MFFYNEQEENGIQVQAGDPYFNNVSLLLKMDTNFSDSSQNNLTVTPQGQATISTSDSKFGGASGFFNRTGSSYLTIQSDSSTAFGTGDFTIEFWVKMLYVNPTYGANIVDNRPTSSNGDYWTIGMAPTGKLVFAVPNNPAIIGTSDNRGVWTHYAATRESGFVRMFINGILEGSGQMLYNFQRPLDTIAKSSWVNFDGAYIEGYLDDLRLTKGVARYTTNFTPPESLPTS